MIINFKHKGLEQYYRTGSKAYIPDSHSNELRVLLTALNAATKPMPFTPAYIQIKTCNKLYKIQILRWIDLPIYTN